MAIIDVVQHADERADEIVHRVPESGPGEFVLGSQLIVRESQAAVFFRDGKALDVFGPGRYTLSTDNIPLLGGLISLPFGGRSPFTAEVYFVAMRDFLDLKWGTEQALTYRDKELGMIRLRAFGTYAMRVADPQLFVTQIGGTRGVYTTGMIEDYLRSVIVTEFNDLLGGVQTSILDLPAMSGELSIAARNALTDDFGRLGLDLRAFQITAITPPDDVQQKIDERSGMAAIGDMNAYMRFKTAQAVGDIANSGGQGGGGAAAGAELGAGFGMGSAMAQAMRDSFASPTPAPAASGSAPGASQGVVYCSKCGTANPAGANFCSNCGAPLAPSAPAGS